MASGTINFNANDGRLAGKIEWSSTSNGSNANTSNVTATLYVRRTDSYTTTGTWNGALNIGGEERGFSVHTGVSSGWVRMQGFTKYNVPHNNDGSGTCWISGYCNGPSGTSMNGVSVSGSQTVGLDKIPRYLSITQFYIQTRQINKVVVKWATSDPRYDTSYSLNGGAWTGSATYGESVAPDTKSGTFNILNLSPNTTYRLKIRCQRTDSGLYTESNEISFTTYDYAKLISVPNINIGASQTIKWSNPNNATTTLKLCKTDNSQIIDYGTVTGTSKTVTPTASTIYALTPNSNTYKARYIITTTQNDKTYTNSKDFTFTVTNSNPTAPNFEYEDLNGNTVALTGNNKILVNKYSQVSVTIKSANKSVAQNSATMKNYKLVIGSKTDTKNYSSTNDVVFSTITPDSGTIIVYANDSRNNTSSKTTTTTFKNYTEPIIKNLEVTRDNNGVSSEVILKFSGSFWNDNFGVTQNEIVMITYNYKETSASDFISGQTEITFNSENGEFNGELKIQGDLGAEGFDVSKTFNIQLNVVDKLGYSRRTTTLGAGTPAMAIYKDKVAIGGKYNTSIDATLQVNGTMNVPDGIDGEAGILSNGITIIRANDSNLFLSANGRIIFFRPKGTTDASAQVSVNNNGQLAATGNIVSGALIKARNSESVYSAKTLYDNASGTTGTVTLSESAANFTFLEIYSNRASGLAFYNKIPSPNGKNATIGGLFPNTNTELYMYVKLIKISGTSITVTRNILAYNTTSGTLAVGNDNNHKIIKVIGYR